MLCVLGQQVHLLCGLGRYGIVPTKVLDTIALHVLPIPLSHHSIGRRHSRSLPPNTASVEEQGDDQCGSEPSRNVLSWERTFQSDIQGETYTPSSAASSMLSGCVSMAPSLAWWSACWLHGRTQ